MKSPNTEANTDTNAMESAPQAHLTIVSMLRQELVSRQIRRGQYSLRSFALSLKLTPAELSELLSGKRKITRKIAQKIFEALSIDPQTGKNLISALPEKQTRQKKGTAGALLATSVKDINIIAAEKEKSPKLVNSFIQLSTDEFRIIADWYHLAILSLAEIKGFRSDIDWICRRLGISKYEAKSAVDTLLRLGLLVQNKSGQFKITGKQFTTTNNLPDSSIRKNHAQSLELALNALESIPVELREFSASVIAVDPDLLPEAKKRLIELRREIAQLLESGPNKKEVYRLSVQLFPLSK